MNYVLPGYLESYETINAISEAIPLKRQSTLEVIVKAVAFLPSECAGYITGQNIHVEGGLTRSARETIPNDGVHG